MIVYEIICENLPYSFYSWENIGDYLFISPTRIVIVWIHHKISQTIRGPKLSIHKDILETAMNKYKDFECTISEKGDYYMINIVMDETQTKEYLSSKIINIPRRIYSKQWMEFNTIEDIKAYYYQRKIIIDHKERCTDPLLKEIQLDNHYPKVIEKPINKKYNIFPQEFLKHIIESNFHGIYYNNIIYTTIDLFMVADNYDFETIYYQKFRAIEFKLDEILNMYKDDIENYKPMDLKEVVFYENITMDHKKNIVIQIMKILNPYNISLLDQWYKWDINSKIVLNFPEFEGILSNYFSSVKNIVYNNFYLKIAEHIFDVYILIGLGVKYSSTKDPYGIRTKIDEILPYINQDILDLLKSMEMSDEGLDAIEKRFKSIIIKEYNISINNITWNYNEELHYVKLINQNKENLQKLLKRIKGIGVDGTLENIRVPMIDYSSHLTVARSFVDHWKQINEFMNITPMENNIQLRVSLWYIYSGFSSIYTIL